MLDQSITEQIKSKVLQNKEKFMINLFQVENVKIKKVFINSELVKEEYFGDIEQNILNADTLVIDAEIEVVAFGKETFDYEVKDFEKFLKRKKDMKKRYFDQEKNIFFLVDGNFSIYLLICLFIKRFFE